MTVEIGVLGPVTLAAGGRPVKLDRRKQRALLAVLALRAGQVVTVEHLLECLWDAAPPATARKQIHVYMSMLRRLLVLAGDAGRVVETTPNGYRLCVPPATVDLTLFADQVAEAGRQDAPEDASRTLGKALALWRGPALDGLTGRFVHGEARRLGELRSTVLQRRLDLDLGLGRHAQLVPELTGLVDADPLHEGLRVRLALALQRCGRTADALAACREGRRLSVRELGIEPAGHLRATELAILRGERAGAPVTPAPVTVTAPCQLPRATAGLTGRDAQVRRIRALLEAPDGPAAVVVTGRPGAGTSSVALQVAHQVRERFPDGQFYVNLRATGGSLDPLLRTLGADGAAHYRQLIADRRMLVVLDDVADERQVRAALPGAAGTAVLIASHSWLPGLDPARAVEVDALAAAPALELLCRAAGAPPDAAAARVVRLCGGLPLALRVAAARLASRPHWTMTDLAAALECGCTRLDLLTAGDVAVRASLRAAYLGRSAPARELFRMLGRGVPETPVPRGPLDELVDAHLVDSEGPQRYRLDALVLLYARELAHASCNIGCPSRMTNRFATEAVTFDGSCSSAEETVTNSAVSCSGVSTART